MTRTVLKNNMEYWNINFFPMKEFHKKEGLWKVHVLHSNCVLVGEKEQCIDFQIVVISGAWINLKNISESCDLKFQIHSMNENIFAAKIPVFIKCQKYSCCVLLASTKFALYHDI
jgi:hypothetical protein